MNRKGSKAGKYLIIVGIILPLTMTGCGGRPQEMKDTVLTEMVGESGEGKQAGAESIAALYRDIYHKAAEADSPGSLEMMKSIIEGFGEKGYSAVDEWNQINMARPEQVKGFCESVEEKEDAELTVIVTAYLGGFTVYNLKTTEGRVTVDRGYYQYENKELKNMSTVSYPAEYWQYTQEGYLLFEGSFYSESYYTLSMSDMSEHTALRVLPLEEECRELNRKYLLPVGYRANNMFLTRWSETEFDSLDFYDLFDRLYPAVYGQPIPYTAEENSGVGTVCRVPENIFEDVIKEYIRIDSKELRQKTSYVSGERAYEYKPRGFYESEYEEVPYPEVVSYTENEDGTTTLVVNAVYPEDNTSRAYTHEVTVRPLGEDRFQYVSNHLTFPENGYDAWWHSQRLTQEQWKEAYGDPDCGEKYGDGTKERKQEDTKDEDEESQEKVLSLYFPEEAESLISEAGKRELEDKALTAAEGVKEIYRDAEVGTDLFDSYRVKNFSGEQRKRVVALLGEAGFTSVADNTDMENYEAVEDFYSSYQGKEDAMVTIINVASDGLLGAFTFIYKDDRLQTYYVEIGWEEGGIPRLTSTLVSDIAEIRLTEKGYFIYAYEVLVHHSSLRQYWRVKPLSDECRRLTEKYISGLSYVNYNMLVTDWDSSSAEKILMPCMFEDLYRIDTGESLKPQNGGIPAQIYERIMTTYFPVTVRQVRENCGYNAQQDNYPYETAVSGPYSPFGEVVDYAGNPDGTLTLFVDGVWPDYDSDCAFRNKIVVKPLEGGSFRYLSNSIEKREMDIPVINPADR